MSETPELDKMNAVQPKSQIIGEFLDWLIYEKGYRIADPAIGGFFNINERLAEYFEIDLNKVDQEQKALLEELRQKIES